MSRKNQYSPYVLLLVVVALAVIGYFVVHKSHAAGADINSDGKVDITDLSILAAHYGMSGQTPATGDIDGNGTVNISDLSILAANWGATSDVTKPTVAMTAPAGGATLTGTATLSATATDNVGVTKVEFYRAGTTLINTDTTSPYSITWDTTAVANGTYSLTAKAYDQAGNTQTSTAVSVTVNNTVASGWWKPTSAHSITWDWQLQGVPSPSLNKQVYDIDGFNSTAANVASYHATGAKVICYISFGSYEDFRSDASSFPSSVLGNTNGWPGERWLDIRQISTLAPIMTARMQMCVQKGFDALEPDNIDGYSNSSGFPLTAANQIAYNTWIANTAHSLGLSVGLKNDIDQNSQLVSLFDWALNEECNSFSECGTLSVFVNANKAVFNAEYGSSTSFCSADAAAHINGARFDLDLTGSTYQPCTQTW